MNADLIVVVGNSDELNIVTRPFPTLEIEILNNNGGKKAPNNTNVNVSKQKDVCKWPVIKSIGGKTIKITVSAPRDMTKLFLNGGTGLATLPLANKNNVKLSAASNTHMIPRGGKWVTVT